MSPDLMSRKLRTVVPAHGMYGAVNTRAVDMGQAVRVCRNLARNARANIVDRPDRSRRRYVNLRDESWC